MPDTSLSEALKEAYALATDVIHLTMELYHPSLTTPIRVVRDHADLEAGLEESAPVNPGEVVLWKAYAFDLTKPEVSTTGVPTITLTIDNISREIAGAIENSLYSSIPIRGAFREYLASDLSTPQNDPVMYMEVMDIKVDVFKVTATLGFPNYQNKRFPTVAYDPEVFTSLAS